MGGFAIPQRVINTSVCPRGLVPSAPAGKPGPDFGEFLSLGNGFRELEASELEIACLGVQVWTLGSSALPAK